jgi:type II secretory ATPase GspE/PulE/Tfp pilus assembly ATPase PilB-like protein
VFTTELTTESAAVVQSLSSTASMRSCPNCNSRDGLHTSRRRNFGEKLMIVLMPLIRAYRCHGCNWRGFLGRFDLLSSTRLNRALNGAVFIVFVLFCFYQIVTYYGIRLIP